MTIKNALLNELKYESANTRKLLERVPFERGDWKPHEKSSTLISLAKHIANLPIWINRIFDKEHYDFAGGIKATEPVNNIQDLLTLYDKKIEDATNILNNSNEEELSKIWTMKHGDQIIRSLPKAAALRNIAFNHLIHHRGQLSVYLRLLDVPIPGMYGPSADEKG
jgi:uncharacterized damage-inducible protein DinB